MRHALFGWRHAGLALCCLALCFSARADGALHPLWELHGKHNTVYLLGSIHVLRPGDYPLPQVMLDAYGSANSLLMEVDLADLDVAQIQGELLAGATLPEGKTLRGILGARRYARADALARALGVELSTLDAYAPWFVAEAISEQQLAALGFEADSGVEMYFVERARNDGKSVAGLETVHDQISLFQSMTLDAQADYLVSSLEEAHELPQQADEMVRAWQRGDAAWFETEIKQEFGKDPALYRTMLTGRNRKWLPKIEALLKENQNYLIIVGTGHLVGRDGVVELLKKDGIEAIQR
jgi:uncharacterized protein YbaP (TraB family)